MVAMGKEKRNELETLAAARPYRSFLPADDYPQLDWNRSLTEKYREDMEPFNISPNRLFLRYTLISSDNRTSLQYNERRQ